MAKYINIGNNGFRKALEGEYVDKSMLIPFVNSTLGTERCMTCVTRARRFGKSMAANMLCAYYDQSCFIGVYMTGILPIKRYNTQSALNNFEEYTMLSPAQLAGYFGFTEQYNDENSLSNVLTLAFYAARRWYSVVRELPTGLGFADIVLIPKKGVDKPAILLELKWNKSADSAIRQIKEKRYAGVLNDFACEVILVGVNYDKKTKHHECKIERLGASVPSLSQVCPKSVLSLSQVLENVNLEVVKVILEETALPVGIDVLMQATSQTNRSRFRATYINPLLSEGHVVMTQPDKPTSPKQQYYRTEKGNELLRMLLN